MTRNTISNIYPQKYQINRNYLYKCICSYFFNGKRWSKDITRYRLVFGSYGYMYVYIYIWNAFSYLVSRGLTPWIVIDRGRADISLYPYFIVYHWKIWKYVLYIYIYSKLWHILGQPSKCWSYCEPLKAPYILHSCASKEVSFVGYPGEIARELSRVQ